MSEPSHLGEAVIGSLRPAAGLSLLGEYQGSEVAESQFLVRRGDGQVIQLSQLLYLVTVAVAEAAQETSRATGADLIAERVSPELGRKVTAANVRFLIATKLAPLGVVIAGAPVEAADQTVSPSADQTVSPPADQTVSPPAVQTESRPADQAASETMGPIPVIRAPAPPTELPARVPAWVPQPNPPPGQQVRGRRRRTVVLGALGAAASVAAVTLTVVALTRPGPAPASDAANRARAAAWVAQQVSPGTVVSCDPATCGQLRSDGFPAARLMMLSPATQDPLGSAVVISTSAVRDQFGTRLDRVYAPLVLAGFGSGANRVEVRATAPDGVAALEAAVSAQQASARSAGRQLLRNRNVQASPAARQDLLEGRVDARLLANLSVLSSQWSFRLMAFDNAPPGASPTAPLRGVQLSATSAAGRSAILAFLRAQRGTYRPAMAAATQDGSGQPVVTARFDAPDPMLTP